MLSHRCHRCHTARALRGDSQTDGSASIAAEKSQEQPKATPTAESESPPPATVPAAGRARIRRSTRGRGRQRHILRHHLSHRRDRATKAGSSHLVWTCTHHRTSSWSLVADPCTLVRFSHLSSPNRTTGPTQHRRTIYFTPSSGATSCHPSSPSSLIRCPCLKGARPPGGKNLGAKKSASVECRHLLKPRPSISSRL